MKNLKKIAAALLVGTLAFSAAACGSSSSSASGSESTSASGSDESTSAEETFEVDDYTTSLAALKGPTGIGLTKLMYDLGSPVVNEYTPDDTADAWTGETLTASGASVEFTLAGAADEITASLLKGEIDMACVPANLAAVLYNKSEGGIKVVGVNTLGVLYIVSNGEEITSMEDLKGKTIVSAGKGSTPEYALRYLLSENGIDPDSDVTIDWKSEHSECVAALAQGTATIAMLPQPFVTVASNQIEGLSVDLDLTEEWDKLDNGSNLITGVVVANSTYIEEHEEDLKAIMADYAKSVDWVNAYPGEAGELTAAYGIIDAAAVATQAIPNCHIVCITGDEMKDALSGYLSVLADADASSVGGSLPEDDFYYIG